MGGLWRKIVAASAEWGWMWCNAVVGGWVVMVVGNMMAKKWTDIVRWFNGSGHTVDMDIPTSVGGQSYP